MHYKDSFSKTGTYISHVYYAKLALNEMFLNVTQPLHPWPVPFRYVCFGARYAILNSKVEFTSREKLQKLY